MKPPLYLLISLVSILLFENIFAQENSDLKTYQRAQYFLSPSKSKIYEAYVTPNWIGKEGVFWYVKDGIEKKEYFIVDPNFKTKNHLFDTDKLAETLFSITGDTIDSNDLPINNIKYDHSGQKIEFEYKEIQFQYEIESNQLDSLNRNYKPSPSEKLSPDGKMVAYVKDYNLYVRELNSMEEIQLTFDGKRHFAYATITESNLYFATITRYNLQLSPVLSWSPDSKKILTHQLDERNVSSTHLLQMVDTDKSLRPKLYTYKYPVPSDTILPLAYSLVIDVEKNKMIRLNTPPFISVAATPLERIFIRIWWSQSGKTIEALYQDRCWNEIDYLLIDPETGQSKSLLKESGESLVFPNLYIFAKANVKYLDSNEFIWFSESSGYGHLYLYDKAGNLKNDITSGEFAVREIVAIDEENENIYFLANGKEENVNPYFVNFYKVSFDGKDLELLTPEKGNHRVHISPDNKYFVSNNSWDVLPYSVLRDTEGNFIMELEQSDFTAWLEKGWKHPETYKMIAADGKTEIYGILFKPSNFEETNKYPILDDVYPGPQINRVGIFLDRKQPFSTRLRKIFSLAELGFLVLTMDGRGTPFRSKEFLNFSYNNLGVAGGMEDHVIGIKQLAERLPYIDTTRVGIYGHSAGGYASMRSILSYPDFYDVAVSSAGNHDQRGYISIWMDNYMCKNVDDNFEEQSNMNLAENLKGKLLLMTGGMDDNCHPSQTIGMVNALIKANRDFDFLLMPGTNHGQSINNPYFLRRRMDYFYQHLLKRNPPVNFKLDLN